MILEQHYLACLAQASYLIVDEKTGTAVVVDPRRDVQLYLDRAGELGATIRHVLLTHFHADFLAGHLELRERCGATIHIGARAQAEFAFEPMADGGALELGDVRLEFLETPGHTPESVSILVYDLAQDRELPHAVLTGDTLFIGDVGRPDLMASVGVTPEELAGMLYESTRTKLLTLPDETIVYPGHGAGSACGKNLSTDTSSTIGAQRATNYALQPMEKGEFVGLVTAGQPVAPAYFAHDARLNRSERPTLDAVLPGELHPLPLEEVLRLQNGGAVVLDTRAADAFAAGHLKGSVHVGLEGKYASWVGTLVSAEATLVLVTEPGQEEESATRLGRIGFDRIAGHLAGGRASVQSRELVGTSTRIGKEELAAELAAAEAPLVLDVRTPGEWEDGHIEGALHVPLSRLLQELERVTRERDVVCVCKTGYRSSTAVSLLARAGFTRARDLVGGMDAWEGREADAPSCSIG